MDLSCKASGNNTTNTETKVVNEEVSSITELAQSMLNFSIGVFKPEIVQENPIQRHDVGRFRIYQVKKSHTLKIKVGNTSEVKVEIPSSSLRARTSSKPDYPSNDARICKFFVNRSLSEDPPSSSNKITETAKHVRFRRSSAFRHWRNAASCERRNRRNNRNARRLMRYDLRELTRPHRYLSTCSQTRKKERQLLDGLSDLFGNFSTTEGDSKDAVVKSDS